MTAPINIGIEFEINKRFSIHNNKIVNRKSITVCSGCVVCGTCMPTLYKIVDKRFIFTLKEKTQRCD